MGSLIMRRMTIPIHQTTTSSSQGGLHRAFITEATKNLRKLFDGRSKKEKEAEEACERALEAAESLKEGAKDVKETCEFVRDSIHTTSETVGDATREIRENVTEATEAVKEKMKEPVKGLVSDAWEASAKKIEDKIVEKIRSRVLGTGAARVEVDRIFGKTKKS